MLGRNPSKCDLADLNLQFLGLEALIPSISGIVGTVLNIPGLDSACLPEAIKRIEEAVNKITAAQTIVTDLKPVKCEKALEKMNAMDEIELADMGDFLYFWGPLDEDFLDNTDSLDVAVIARNAGVQVLIICKLPVVDDLLVTLLVFIDKAFDLLYPFGADFWIPLHIKSPFLRKKSVA